METNDYVVNAVSNFNNITQKPEEFLSVQNNNSNEICLQLKTTYDFIKTGEPKIGNTNALPELIVENFDLEQIWQQLELQNEEFLTKSLPKISNLIVQKDGLLFQELKTNVESENSLQENGHDENKNEGDSDSDIDSNISEESSINTDDSHENHKQKQEFHKIRPSVVDDKFFKLDEMEKFLKAEETKISNGDKKIDLGNDSESDEEHSIDLFDAEDGEDDDGSEKDNDLNNPKYNDFFGDDNVNNKKTSKKLFDERENQDDKDIKSTFELREERLNNKINEIEQYALSEKPWQLKGEITAENRPQNSLLEEIVDFDLVSRPAPVITEQTSLQLEDIIRQRIKDRVFDSVQRKEKPVETPLEYKKKLVLDQEKSKESLAQIYEKEYLRQKEALDPDGSEKPEEEPQLHKEIKTMMHNLFIKLDALSNFHFTPKYAAPELKIVSNLPAINMEEIAPVAASDAALLAPEEIKAKTKGDTIGKTERTDTDKKRERRKKKLKQKIHAKEKKKGDELINKIRPGLGNKYSKEKAQRMMEKVTKEKNVDKLDETYGSKGIKSSTAFFTQLEDEVKSYIQNKSKSKNSKKNEVNAKKIKL